VVHDDSELILVHLDGGCSCRQLLHHSGGLGGDSGRQGLGEFGGGGHDGETGGLGGDLGGSSSEDGLALNTKMI
jgi:hypothetical protein